MITYCGQICKDGMPCNMFAGHKAKYHRHTENNSILWRISTRRGNVIEYGSGKLPLYEAISRWSSKRLYIKVEIER